MGFLGLFQEENLCNQKTFDNIITYFPNCLVLHAEESTRTLIKICQQIKSNSNTPYKDFFTKSYKSLLLHLYETHQDNYHHIPLDKEQSLQATTAKFIYYYLKILTILLKSTTAEKKHFSKQEYSAIRDACCKYALNDSAFSDNYYLSSWFINDTHSSFVNAAKASNEDEKMFYINDYSVIFTKKYGDNDNLPIYNSLTQNEHIVLNNLLDKYFIIFYKSLQDYLSENFLGPMVCGFVR